MSALAAQERDERGEAPEAASPESRPRVAPALERELRAGRFEYPWPVAPGVTAPVGGPAARHSAWTLESMLEDPFRDAVAAAGPEGPAAALILGCGEGRLAHRLVEWGAARVVGVETCPSARRRATLLRDHLGLAAARFELRETWSFETLPSGALGDFAAVVVPVLSGTAQGVSSTLALVRAATRGLCAFVVDGRERASLDPSLCDAGFEHLEAVSPPPEAERRWVLGERVLLLARPGRPR